MLLRCTDELFLPAEELRAQARGGLRSQFGIYCDRQQYVQSRETLKFERTGGMTPVVEFGSTQ